MSRPVAILEGAHVLAGDERQWLHHLTESIRRGNAEHVVANRLADAGLGDLRARYGHEALVRAARRANRARGPLRRRDPSEAVEIWRGLVAGRWSLVDRFDANGRSFLLVHKNDPSTRAPRGLTERERQVIGYANLGRSNKFIAYELGISPSTVGVILTNARAKLKTITGT